MNNTRDIQTVMREQVIPEGSARYGVVIGIEKYHDEKLNLRCAQADAQAVYDLMIDPECGMFPEKNVTLLLDDNATREKIRRSLASLKRKVGKNDTVWLYYAGHAAPEDDDFHWVPYDADIDDLFTSGLAREDITRLLNSFKAERVITFLDCCHAAVMGVQKNKTRAVLTAEEMFDAYKGTGFVTLSSSSGQEKSIELTEEGHGAFTWFLLKGLRGAADLEKAGVISLDCLWKYLQGKVAEVSAKAGNTQTPVLIGEHTHNLALTINPLEVKRKKIIADKIHSLIGIGKEKLSTKEAEICLNILRRNPQNSTEKDIAIEFDSLVKDKIRISTFKRLIVLPKKSTKPPSRKNKTVQGWWHLSAIGEEKQITEQELIQLIESGNLPNNTEVWRKGFEEWIYAKDCLEFSIAFADKKLKAEIQYDIKQINIAINSRKGSKEYIKKVHQKRIKIWKNAAEKGWAEGQYLIGCCLELGCGYTADAFEAAKWYRKAAEQGDTKAQLNLGVYYANGEGVSKDLSEAVKWYRKAAKQGYAIAQNSLASFYANGKGLEKDLNEAVKWYRKAAEQEHVEAQFALGNFYYIGKGVKEDMEEAVKWYRKAAEQGDTKAQHNLAICYTNGEGVSKDLSEAVKWFRKAADQGDAEAQHNLGICYTNGEGVSKDLSEAVKWFSKAADQEDAEAQFSLGNCYKNGDGVSKDLSEAVKWYRKAAKQGNAKAQHNLAFCYYHGEGIEKDQAEAVKWYRKAAEQGDAKAQHYLAICYYHGEGVSKDLSEAVKWFRKAADQGDAEAQFNLGVYYENEEGASKDLSEAVEWYRKAADQGNEDAKKRLKELQ